jgi:hypothetical protein
MVRAQNVLEEEWDCLVVLDACRYDAFAELHGEYLEGTVEKRRSPGSSTPEWAAKTFTGEHDIAYFSGNPFINSLGIPLSELKWGASCDYDWTASDHIAEVFDLWQSAWDDDLGTIPPGNVNEAVRANRDAVDRRDRTVVHYMQPHAPYLQRGTGRKLTRIRDGISAQAEAGEDGDGGSETLIGRMSDAARNRIESTLGDSSLAMQLGMWAELDADSLPAVGADGSRRALRRYYDENLRLVLESVRELLPEFDGPVVVTADHGEAFGEQGVWEHHIETHIPALTDVPWFRVS